MDFAYNWLGFYFLVCVNLNFTFSIAFGIFRRRSNIEKSKPEDFYLWFTFNESQFYYAKKLFFSNISSIDTHRRCGNLNFLFELNWMNISTSLEVFRSFFYHLNVIIQFYVLFMTIWYSTRQIVIHLNDIHLKRTLMRPH